MAECDDHGHVERERPKEIPESVFAGDDGSRDPALARVLQDFGSGACSAVDVVDGLYGTRLLVPVVAVLDSSAVNEHGIAVDKDSHMSSVSIQTPDGRQALVAFTDVASIKQWRSDARPIPVAAAEVALAALQEGHDAVLIDVASSHRIAVEGPLLARLALGQQALQDRLRLVVADVVADVRQMTGTTMSIECTECTEAPGLDCLLIVTNPDPDPARVSRFAQAVASRLADDPVVKAATARGLEIGVEEP